MQSEPGQLLHSAPSKKITQKIDSYCMDTLSPRLTVFAALNNAFNDPSVSEIYGPSTPEVAQFRQQQN